MGDKYLEFFNRISKAYGQVGGYASLLKRIDDGEFKDGLAEREYEIAITQLHTFFIHKNTHGQNRLFGLSNFDIEKLVTECENKERILNNSRQ
jgi:hypothetical protein